MAHWWTVRHGYPLTCATAMIFCIFFIYRKYSIYTYFNIGIYIDIYSIIHIAEQYTKYIDHICIITENRSQIIIYITSIGIE